MKNALASLDRVDPWDGRRVEKPAVSNGFLPPNGFVFVNNVMTQVDDGG